MSILALVPLGILTNAAIELILQYPHPIKIKQRMYVLGMIPFSYPVIISVKYIIFLVKRWRANR